MSVAVVSLYPLDATGGGELFTVQAAQAICAAGERTVIAAPVDVPPPRSDLQTRLDTRFVVADVGADVKPDVLAWRDVLTRLADHDHVWVHQYLACDLVFDLIGTVASDQHLLFTSEGFEVLRDLFVGIYQPCPRHHFVEISAYAARRAARYAPHATWAHAGVWRADFAPLASATSPRRHDFTALGRVLPHKGLETTIDALGAGDTLHIIGPTPDASYADFLRERARNKDVVFHGCLPRDGVQYILAETTALVSASTHHLFDGRRIEQPELLGLVLCEALRDGTLPLASNVPASAEVMTALGLSEWTFPENDASALYDRFERLSDLDNPARYEQLVAGREKLLSEFAWDDYWPRVLARIEERAACA